MSAHKKAKSKLRTVSNPNRKQRGKPRRKVRRKISASVRANSSPKLVSRVDAVGAGVRRPRSRKSTAPIITSKTAPEICAAHWPEDPKALRRLIPEPVHTEADRLELWSRDKLVATAQFLRLTGKRPDPVQRLRSTGQIIDGRNARLMALMLGVKPDFVEVDLPESMTPADFVEFRNVVRRQLSFDKLALVAAKRYIVLREEGKKRRIKNLRKGTRVPEVEKVLNRDSMSSIEFVANLFSVNTKYIQDATTILDQAPKLFAKIETGEVEFSDARAAMGLVHHRSRKNEPDRQMPIASVNDHHPHKTDVPVTPRGIDSSAILAKLLKEILRIDSTPQPKRELAIERLIQKALAIQTQQQEAGRQGPAASAQ